MGRETQRRNGRRLRRHDRWRGNNNGQTGRLGEGGRKNYRSVEVGGPRKREGGGATRCQENRPGENKLNLAE